VTRRLLIAGGGTLLGASQLHALGELGPPRPDDEGHASSIGAVNLALWACGRLGVLEAVWRSVRGVGDFQRLALFQALGDLLTRPLTHRGLFSLAPLRQLLREHFHPGDLRCDVYAVVVQLDAKAVHRVRLNNLDQAAAIDAIIASCSQYPIHRYVEIGGHPCADGGIVAKVPVPPRSWWGKYSEAWALATEPIDQPGRDHAIDANEVGPMRPVELQTDVNERRSYLELRRLSQRLPTWLVQPAERPASPWDASSVGRLLDTVGPEAWAARRSL